MRFSFDKAACQNTRRALHKEWLLTNGLGDYASSSVLCCNTRKYHGLLAVNTPLGRHVLLSALEESVLGGGKEFFLSTRQHPRTLHPRGHEYLESVCLDHWPQFTYRVGDVRLRREMFLVRGASRLALRWSIQGISKLPPLTLRIRPLLAYRHFHALTTANPHLNAQTTQVPQGFSITPYAGLPTLFVQVSGPHAFLPAPDWFHHVEYMQERERGFAYSEDLFQPGILEIPLPPLRERREDIPLLVAHFVEKVIADNNMPSRAFSTEALNYLTGYEWPGNIRQLENVVESCLVLVPGSMIEVDNLPAEIRDEESQFKSAVDLLPVQLDLADTLEKIEAALIRRALVRADLVQVKAAEYLGISKSLLQYKLKKYGITGH